MTFRISIALLLLCALCGPLCAGEEIRADRSETFMDTSGIVRSYAGGVAARFGGVTISADSARAWMQEKRYFFTRGVSYEDSARRVRADTLEYDFEEEVAAFRGRVELEGAGRTLSGRRVAYRLRERLLSAVGGIVLAYPEQGMSVRTERLRYDAAGDSGRAVGGAEAVRFSETPGDTLRLAADTLRFYGQGRRMYLSGDVRMDQGGMHALAGGASYIKEGGRVTLEQAPRATWKRDRGAHRDSVDVRADRLVFGLEGEQIRELSLLGAAEIRMETQRDGGEEMRSVRADTSVVRLREDRIEEVEATGGVGVSVLSEDGAETDLRGDSVRMFFADGELDSMVLEGESAITYVPADRKAFDRISGRRMSIGFEGGAIRHVLVEDEAACEHTAREDGEETTRVTGDRIDLAFEGGDLQRALATGGVKGHYAPAGEEERP